MLELIRCMFRTDEALEYDDVDAAMVVSNELQLIALIGLVLFEKN